MGRRRLRRQGATILGISLIVSISGCGAVVAQHSALSFTEQSFPQVPSAPPTAVAVDFLSMGTGFLAVNDAILATQNGGKNWATHILPQHLQPIAMDFLSAKIGWVVAEEGNTPNISYMLLKTTNGGVSWQSFPLAANAQLDMTSSESGFAIIGAELYTTHTGGDSWQPISLPEGERPVYVTFNSLEQGWIVVNKDGQSDLLVTTNGGKNFHNTFSSTSPIDAVTFSSPTHGLMLLGSQQYGTPNLGNLEQTQNGGETWSVLQSAAEWTSHDVYGFFQSMSLSGEHDVWIGTTSGAMGFSSSGLLVSPDGGTHWHSLGTRRHWNIVSEQMVAPGAGWVLGSDFLLKTTDNGQHWTDVWPARFPQQEVDFVSTAVGYGLGEEDNPYAVLKTVNGGKGWTVVNADPPADFSQISFVGSAGWAIADATDGSRVEVFRSENGGVSWRLLSSEPTSLSLSIKMFTKEIGVLDTFETLYKTTDGGVTWQAIADNAPGPTPLTDYLSPVHEWLINSVSEWGTKATLTWSANGGRSNRVVYIWPQESNVSYIPGSIDFINEQNGWVWMQKMVRTGKLITKPGSSRRVPLVGEINLLYHTSDGGKTWSITRLPQDLSPGADALDFVSNRRGYLFVNNTLLYTTTGGRRWRVVSTDDPSLSGR
ncbi:MAG: YCF48-related protein [Firmicutes bacterium]|nr:YCF48-related protein [Bacillota bacterium]